MFEVLCREMKGKEGMSGAFRDLGEGLRARRWHAQTTPTTPGMFKTRACSFTSLRGYAPETLTWSHRLLAREGAHTTMYEKRQGEKQHVECKESKVRSYE